MLLMIPMYHVIHSVRIIHLQQRKTISQRHTSFTKWPQTVKASKFKANQLIAQTTFNYM
ncbi:hypothetical protein WN55_00866 [Dufourea novaeangliae]|uniref:Uncharacterized protein n=1 Tax=Dufourea novaeangliae TaxID=178035 RepID=A0A154PD29_DUFNO|nr:hypothetical protein WN55_00866 [Dufourea novaeangliae]